MKVEVDVEVGAHLTWADIYHNQAFAVNATLPMTEMHPHTKCTLNVLLIKYKYSLQSATNLLISQKQVNCCGALSWAFKLLTVMCVLCSSSQHHANELLLQSLWGLKSQEGLQDLHCTKITQWLWRSSIHSCLIKTLLLEKSWTSQEKTSQLD